MSKAAEDTEEQEFMAVLEQGVRDVLRSKKATVSERVAAINAGAKVIMIKNKIEGADDSGFFNK